MEVGYAAPLTCTAMLYLATLRPSWSDDLRLLDAIPVPCGATRQTVRRSELAGQANHGYCTAHSRWYWGLKLHLIITAEGDAGGLVAGRSEDRRARSRRRPARSRPRHRALRAGMIMLADKGLAGRELERYAAEEVKVLVRPDRKDERRRYGNLGARWTAGQAGQGPRMASPS